MRVPRGGAWETVFLERVCLVVTTGQVFDEPAAKLWAASVSPGTVP